MESGFRTKTKFRISRFFIRIIEKTGQNLQNYLYISPLKKTDQENIFQQYKILLNNDL
jgi:hypothetical protein